MTAFIGPGQRSKRLEALCLQECVLNDAALAADIEGAGEPVTFSEGEPLVSQGDDDDDVYFLLGGYVDLLIHGHFYLRREARDLVGEMAVLEPGSRRSASVVAGSGGVTAIKLSCEDFMRLGAAHVTLWRNVARVLSVRLRQRNAYFVQPNEVSKVFLASSGLGKPILQLLEADLKRSGLDVHPWTDDDIFKPSDVPMESLEEQSRTVDFAVIVATADDFVTKNFLKRWRSRSLAARDNVLLEFGLFAGALDRRRVFIVEEDDARLKLPSDLGGLTRLRFKSDDDVHRASERIVKRISEKGPIRRVRATVAVH